MIKSIIYNFKRNIKYKLFNKGSYVLDPFRYIKKRDGVKIIEIGEGEKI